MSPRLLTGLIKTCFGSPLALGRGGDPNEDKLTRTRGAREEEAETSETSSASSSTRSFLRRRLRGGIAHRRLVRAWTRAWARFEGSVVCFFEMRQTCGCEGSLFLAKTWIAASKECILRKRKLVRVRGDFNRQGNLRGACAGLGRRGFEKCWICGFLGPGRLLGRTQDPGSQNPVPRENPRDARPN